MKLAQLKDIVMGNIFEKNVYNMDDWVLETGPFQFTNLRQLIKNPLCSILLFRRCIPRRSKIVNIPVNTRLFNVYMTSPISRWW